MLECADDWGVEEEHIDEELSDARERMSKLHNHGRHSKMLQRKIRDFDHLVELCDLMLPKNAFDTRLLTEETADAAKIHKSQVQPERKKMQKDKSCVAATVAHH